MIIICISISICIWIIILKMVPSVKLPANEMIENVNHTKLAPSRIPAISMIENVK